MKKWLMPIILVTCIMALVSCKPENINNPLAKVDTDGGLSDNGTHNASGFEECNFSVQYIRTNGYHDGVQYPVVTVIHSVEELNAYYEANKDKYSLERRTGTIYSDSTIGFLDACDKYDEEYFENRILLMVLLEEGSGSIRHKVERVSTDAGKIVVEIDSIVPEIFTDDMAEWHILIELEKGVDSATEDDVEVFLDGIDATEKITEVYYEKGFANISLALNEGWEYDIVDEADTKEFSINIYPQGQKDDKLRIVYFDFFGVCGTELKQEEIKLGKYDAWMGTYYNNTVWNFISIQNTFGNYVIFNDGKAWWKEYGDEAMKILATLNVGEGYVSPNEAIRIAKDKADSADEDPEVIFDEEKAVWSITLFGNNTSGDDTFVIDIHGNIIEIIE